jgi:conjugal transfer/entry exclusion protein
MSSYENYPQLRQISNQIREVAGDLSNAQGRINEAVNLSRRNSANPVSKAIGTWEGLRGKLPQIIDELYTCATQLSRDASSWEREYENERNRDKK